MIASIGHQEQELLVRGREISTSSYVESFNFGKDGPDKVVTEELRSSSQDCPGESSGERAQETVAMAHWPVGRLAAGGDGVPKYLAGLSNFSVRL